MGPLYECDIACLMGENLTEWFQYMYKSLLKCLREDWYCMRLIEYSSCGLLVWWYVLGIETNQTNIYPVYVYFMFLFFVFFLLAHCYLSRSCLERERSLLFLFLKKGNKNVNDKKKWIWFGFIGKYLLTDEWIWWNKEGIAASSRRVKSYFSRRPFLIYTK